MDGEGNEGEEWQSVLEELEKSETSPDHQWVPLRAATEQSIMDLGTITDSEIEILNKFQVIRVVPKGVPRHNL